MAERFLDNRLTAVWGCLLVGFSLIQSGCAEPEPTANKKAELTSPADDSAKTRSARLSKYPALLSEFELFESPMANLTPASGVVEYELNTPLFSDYSLKQRLVKIPSGTQAKQKPDGKVEFPVGTIIAKTFYYRADMNDEQSEPNLIETRILEKRPEGWIGIPYVWNEDKSDAELTIAGNTQQVSWKHRDGNIRQVSYNVPNLNDCKRCHTGNGTEPIGPKISNLNRDLQVGNQSVNQIKHWCKSGLLSETADPETLPRLAKWDDTSETIDRRARAYLDVNCAHCHKPDGPARNSGLHLNVDEKDLYHLGAFKTPIAAGKGTGGRLYGIVPGKPEKSILEYRMFTLNPGEVMPEFGKSMVHDEGLALIREWIAAMEPIKD